MENKAQKNRRANSAPRIITADELIKLSDNFTIERLHIAGELYKKSLAAYTKKYPRNPEFAAACALGNVWNAGRIQGKRDERARRKPR